MLQNGPSVYRFDDFTKQKFLLTAEGLLAHYIEHQGAVKLNLTFEIMLLGNESVCFRFDSVPTAHECPFVVEHATRRDGRRITMAWGAYETYQEGMEAFRELWKEVETAFRIREVTEIAEKRKELGFA
jgi:hypothetical protein